MIAETNEALKQAQIQECDAVKKRDNRYDLYVLITATYSTPHTARSFKTEFHILFAVFRTTESS